MSLRDELVIKLEEENDWLRARVCMLEEIAGVGFESPPALGFTRNESVIFGLLLKNRLVPRRSMMDALYLHQQDEANIKIVDVWVCKMRKKLKPYGVEIQTQWGQGYFLSTDSKLAAQKMLDQAAGAA